MTTEPFILGLNKTIRRFIISRSKSGRYIVIIRGVHLFISSSIRSFTGLIRNEL